MDHPIQDTERERPSVDWTFVRRCRSSHGADPCHQGRRPLSLLRLASAPAWRIQNCISRVDLPCSGDRPGVTMSARLVSFDQKRTELTPGTVLVREWDRRSQRVMVMVDGFAWNGQTYDSLSKVAFAITGTKWSGPRFFGLRDKESRLDAGARS